MTVDPASGERAGQVNALLWHFVRPIIWVRRGRLPPASMPDQVWYLAYGSNMNERLFRERRHMVWSESWIARLDGYRLVFSVGGGMKPGVAAPANIVEASGESVWGVLYLLPLRKFARLDNSEGKQYAYLWREVEDTAGKRVRAVTYQVPHAASDGRPGRRYLDLIREAARQRALPAEYVDMLDRVETRD
jgi:cation transport regulator ChaC